MRALVALVLPVLALAGCERGCLATWLGDHTSGGSSPGGSEGRDAARGIDLSGTDCSDGLARCVSGRMEISRAAHVPYPCKPSEKRGTSCECPWDAAGICATGCSADGFEVVASPETARAQLCRPELPVARPFGPADAPVQGVCTDEGITCVESVVRSCEGPGKPVRPFAICTDGCATEVGALQSDHGPSATLDGVAEILCRRAHAERR